MRRLGLIVLLAVLTALAAGQPYTITAFSCDIELRSNATIGVTESIQVRFNEDRHGIYRFIPIDLETGRGLARRLFLTNISVTDPAGQKQGTKISRQGSNLNVRIGDEDILIPAGTTKTYVIRYDAANAINWFGRDQRWDPAAQLYWNVTGNEWDAPIETTDVRVRFPRGQGGEGIRARVLTGVYGSTDGLVLEKLGSTRSAATVLNLGQQNLEIRHARPLIPGEGLTFVLDVPSDLIHKPDLLQTLWMLVLPNLGLSIPLFALAYALFAYSRYGKDPRPGPMVVQFDPPDGISGPELGAFMDERVDQRDIAAGVFSLAVKGYLTLETEEVGLLFKKQTANLRLTGKGASGDLTAFESALLTHLGKCSQPIDETELRKHVAPNLYNLKQSIYQSLVQRGYYASNPYTSKTVYVLVGAAMLALLFFVMTALSPINDPTASIIGCVLGGLVILTFTPAMAKRTVRGARAHDLARGFEDFIRRAKGQEIDWMSKKHPDAALFEAFLPHAIALGLAKEWASAFDGVLHEMPRWYHSPYGTTFHPASFGSDIVTVSNSLGSAASTPPRSSGASGGGSGFGGGGFSGGGFGGGGGGSW